jgi:hypothetical protein
MFIAAIFIIIKTIQVPINRWISKMYSIQAMEYYSALNINSDTCYNMDES